MAVRNARTDRSAAEQAEGRATLEGHDRPNGPVAAALLAGGIGSAALGVVTTLAEASVGFRNSLNWFNPVGPLTGKALIGTIAFFLSWLILGFALRGKEVNFNRYATIALILLVIGLIGTFPLFFELFAAE
ncbi:MAG: hypothetical protein M1546_13760 [Chloroflexi bacterium]|nr:hypothetical protein [Chloroflexota bacterium]